MGEKPSGCMNGQSVSTDKFAFAGDLRRECGWSSIRDALVDLAFSRDWDSGLCALTVHSVKKRSLRCNVQGLLTRERSVV